ncbi:hypothetical protein RRG08_004296 [Elysia crispata]|uniref:Uncharacterized protein n=1 Tax=Elysia crispata TaxID=231223 RepID=A0AAE0YBW9_9GAST|nr:hypothetical protein RRG08_004296 [Elysia crispata]
MMRSLLCSSVHVAEFEGHQKAQLASRQSCDRCRAGDTRCCSRVPFHKLHAWIWPGGKPPAPKASMTNLRDVNLTEDGACSRFPQPTVAASVTETVSPATSRMELVQGFRSQPWPLVLLRLCLPPRQGWSLFKDGACSRFPQPTVAASVTETVSPATSRMELVQGFRSQPWPLVLLRLSLPPRQGWGLFKDHHQSPASLLGPSVSILSPLVVTVSEQETGLTDYANQLDVADRDVLNPTQLAATAGTHVAGRSHGCLRSSGSGGMFQQINSCVFNLIDHHERSGHHIPCSALRTALVSPKPLRRSSSPGAHTCHDSPVQQAAGHAGLACRDGSPGPQERPCWQMAGGQEEAEAPAEAATDSRAPTQA